MPSSPTSAPSQFSPARPDLPIDVSVIIPARDEAAAIGDCLSSLTTQTGATFEILVVDDGSTDHTREIARTFPGVQVIVPDLLPLGWTGKNNAIDAATKYARAPWLLFTDADTVHLPGSLARAFDEAQREQADLLSYSPEQVVVTFGERAVMPLVFAELAAQYPPHKVRQQNSGLVAANGQYILVRRAAYESVGGHAAVATEILEDVALARRFRDAGYRVHFRYGGDAVRTRMYRNWPQLREGWTKNLALLFPRPGFLAFQTVLLWLVAWPALALAVSGAFSRNFAWLACAILWLLLVVRIRAARFSIANSLLAVAFGPPLFAYLLLRSKRARAAGQVEWKGRTYVRPNASESDRGEGIQPIPAIPNQGARAKS